jgi:hypothetical protein
MAGCGRGTASGDHCNCVHVRLAACLYLSFLEYGHSPMEACPFNASVAH